MFSARIPSGEGRNRLAAAIADRRAHGLPIIDLTLSNPTRANLDYPQDLLTPLADTAALIYEPKAFGLESARDAVARDYARRGIAVPPARIVLTASTSEAYSALLKLLCDPGDVVLAPRPSYPLVEHLAALDAVRLQPYAIEWHGSWTIDVDAIERTLEEQAADARIRAIIVISPNNPTGSIATEIERARIQQLAAEHDVAIIADEVFADYPLAASKAGSGGAGLQPCLEFRLGGLSKTIGLPQAKLGWIAASGPDELVCPALERLDTICDAYLSVSTSVQIAAPKLLQRGAGIRAQIQSRVKKNLRQLEETIASHSSCTLLMPDAGWYAVVQIPAVKSEEAFVVELLQRDGVLVHPGYFFDFDREAFVVLSLLAPPDQFAEGGRALFAAAERS